MTSSRKFFRDYQWSLLCDSSAYPKHGTLWSVVTNFLNPTFREHLKTSTAWTSLFWLTIVFYHQVMEHCFEAVLFMVNPLMLIFSVSNCGVKKMLRQTWLLAMACYVLNYIIRPYVHPNIWFGTHLPKVTKTYQVQHQHLIHFLVGFAVLALVTIIPLMITRYYGPTRLLILIYCRLRSFHSRPVLGGQFWWMRTIFLTATFHLAKRLYNAMGQFIGVLTIIWCSQSFILI